MLMTKLGYQIPNFSYPGGGNIFDQVVAQAKAAEAAGFDRLFMMDHFYQLPGIGEPDAEMFECYTMLSALAQHTQSVRLSALVTGNTYRHPTLLAKAVTALDHVSGGRATLGIGAGWYEAEHTKYGIPFPSTGERFDRFEDNLAIITGLWAAEGDFTYEGRHYSVTDSPGLPKPTQTKPPVLIGGLGKKRTPALTARYADEFNLPFVDEETTAAQFARVRTACEAIERDPDDLGYSNALVLCVGSDEAELDRRAQKIGRDKDELRENGLAGTPDEVVAKARRYADLGSQRLYLQVLDLADLDHLDLVAAEVMPHVGG